MREEEDWRSRGMKWDAEKMQPVKLLCNETLPTKK